MKFIQFTTQSKKSKNSKKKKKKVAVQTENIEASQNEILEPERTQSKKIADETTTTDFNVGDIKIEDLTIEPGLPVLDSLAKIDSKSVNGGDREDIFTWRNLKIDLSKSLAIQILDFGNAIHISEKHSSNIQTKEYRCPETILGIKYNQKADMWSVACIVLELLTGEYLFNPKTHKKLNVSEDDDHLGLMMSTLGEMPKLFALSGSRSLDFFTKAGKFKAKSALNLNSYSISDILIDDFKFEETEALEIEEFLLPMLAYDPEKRKSASEMLTSSWLSA